MTAWNHLPNALLIDQVLLYLAACPDQFAAAGFPILHAVGNKAERTVRRRAWNVAQEQTKQAERYWSWNGAQSEARNALCEGAWIAATDAMLALVAYDDADQYLDMTCEELRFWAVLSHAPAATLLQPYVRARELIDQLHSQEVAA